MVRSQDAASKRRLHMNAWRETEISRPSWLMWLVMSAEASGAKACNVLKTSSGSERGAPNRAGTVEQKRKAQWTSSTAEAVAIG